LGLVLTVFTLNIQPDVKLTHGGNIFGGILIMLLILFAGAGCASTGNAGLPQPNPVLHLS
jgi:hypothetical protein